MLLWPKPRRRPLTQRQVPAAHREVASLKGSPPAAAVLHPPKQPPRQLHQAAGDLSSDAPATMTGGQAGRQAGRQAGGGAGRQAGRRGGRQAGGQADRWGGARGEEGSGGSEGSGQRPLLAALHCLLCWHAQLPDASLSSFPRASKHLRGQGRRACRAERRPLSPIHSHILTPSPSLSHSLEGAPRP